MAGSTATWHLLRCCQFCSAQLVLLERAQDAEDRLASLRQTPPPPHDREASELADQTTDHELSSFAAAQDRRRKGVALLRIRLAYLARGERDDPHAAATNPG